MLKSSNLADPSNGNPPRPATVAPAPKAAAAPAPPPVPPKKTEQQQQPQQLFDLIGQPGSQAPRPGAMQVLPGLNKAKQPEILQRLSVATAKDDQFPDESFFEMLMKCQGSRIEEQRSSLPASNQRGGPAPIPLDVGPPLEAPTVPDEDFFNLIQRVQSGRLEDQRASLPRDKIWSLSFHLENEKLSWKIFFANVLFTKNIQKYL